MENKEFKPFDKVLVRDIDSTEWKAALYSHYDPDEKRHCASVCKWVQCIPYEGNEHLVGTTDSPKSKKWRAQIGEIYYYVRYNGSVWRTTEGDKIEDAGSYNIGNYFRTKEEAEAVAEKVRKLFKGE